jgi:hypothetical protein
MCFSRIVSTIKIAVVHFSRSYTCLTLRLIPRTRLRNLTLDGSIVAALSSSPLALQQ